MPSKTQKALELVRKGMTAYAAAKEVGISKTAVYRAVIAEAKPRCPKCGQTLKRNAS